MNNSEFIKLRPGIELFWITEDTNTIPLSISSGTIFKIVRKTINEKRIYILPSGTSLSDHQSLCLFDDNDAYRLFFTFSEAVDFLQQKINVLYEEVRSQRQNAIRELNFIHSRMDYLIDTKRQFNKLYTTR